MKATGIVRKLDDFGRIVLPRELRTTLKMNVGDPVEIFVDDDEKIILKKFERSCMVCGEMDQDKLINYKGRLICKKCATGMGKAAVSSVIGVQNIRSEGI